jgi:hypothetical protein
MKRSVLFLAALALLLGGVGQARAGSIILGGTGSNNTFPLGFTTPSPGYLGEYQQIYASSAFPGPVTIESIAFSSSSLPGNPPPTTRTVDMTVGLSPTTATPSNPGTSYDANKGPGFTTVFSGPLTFHTLNQDTFDVVIPLTTPFTYDPSSGNLLLDVFVNSSSGGNAAFQFGFNSPDTGRLYNSGGVGAPTAGPHEGLLTEFTTAVPEPSGFTLLGLGSLGLLVSVRRGRKQAD